MDETQPTITLPIHEFLEYLWTYKDKAFIYKESDVANCLRANPNEASFHLEEGPKLAIIWRAKDWKLSQEKYALEKELGDKRVANWNLRQEIKNELKSLIITKIGAAIGIEESLSESIINQRNIAMIKEFGGTEELCQKLTTLI